MASAALIDDTGLLAREAGGFVLKRDAGGRLLLELGRVPVDLVEKRVRIIGLLLDDGRVSVEGVQAA